MTGGYIDQRKSRLDAVQAVNTSRQAYENLRTRAGAIAREIEAAFAADAAAGPIRLPATIFLVSARRPI